MLAEKMESAEDMHESIPLPLKLGSQKRDLAHRDAKSYANSVRVVFGTHRCQVICQLSSRSNWHTQLAETLTIRLVKHSIKAGVGQGSNLGPSAWL